MTGNYFLDALAAEDRATVREVLTSTRLEAGETLIALGAPVTVVHFPVTARLSNLTSSPDGDVLETAVVGREGLSGLAPFMADALCTWAVVATVGGEAWAAPADALQGLTERRPGLRARLLTLTAFYQAQANQLALCNTRHRTAARLARWLLVTSDLTGSDQFELTQEQIAAALGVQRTSVVEAFAALKARDLLRHRRSHVEIIDRPGLTRHACGCYRQLHDLALDLRIVPGNR